MVSHFGSTVPIIPVLGNHDTYPSNIYPATGEAFYGRYLYEGSWSNIIPRDGHEDFKKGGYYRVHLKSKLDVLALNTNLYYKNNFLRENVSDPKGQLAWMKRCLQESKDRKRKVVIAAHIPPGYFERLPSAPYFPHPFNDAYIDLLNAFGDVILTQVYGHQHTDSFRLFRNSSGDVTSVAFLSPSVTPIDVVNPSIRLYSFTPAGLDDYTQYHLDLSSRPSDSRDPPRWKRYYKATEAFGVSSLSKENMAEALGRLRVNDTFFQEYYAKNWVGIAHEYCNETCKQSHLCALANVKAEPFEQCINSSHILSDSSSLDNYDVVLGLAVGVLLVLVVGVIAVAIWSQGATRSSPRSAASELEWLNREPGYAPLSTAEVD